MDQLSGSLAYKIDDKKKCIRHPKHGTFRVTPTQYDILKFLHDHKGEVFSQEEIVEQVWGVSPHTERKIDNVRVQIMGLRGDDKKDIVETIRPRGYAVGFFDGGYDENRNN